MLCCVCSALQAELLCPEAWGSLLYSYTGCRPRLGWRQRNDRTKGQIPWVRNNVTSSNKSQWPTGQSSGNCPVREGVPTPRPSSNGPATFLTFKLFYLSLFLCKHPQPIVNPPFIFSCAALLPQHLPPSPGPPSLTSVPAQPAKFFNIKIMAHLTLLLLQIAAS